MLALAAIVVFVTTYTLILPGFTLDAKTAAEKGGIDVPESAPVSDDTDEPVLNDASPETQSTEEKGLVYKGEGCTIVVDDSRAPLPEDTQLSVTEIDKETDPDAYTELFDKADEAVRNEEEGMYIGHFNGYYLKNAVVPYKSNNNVLGIEKTSQMSYPADSTGAAKYYFEPVEGAENQYYIYCYDSSNQKQYVYNQNSDSLQLSPDTKTAYVVTVNNNGRFSFKAADNNRYWNMWGGAKCDRGCAAYAIHPSRYAGTRHLRTPRGAT